MPNNAQNFKFFGVSINEEEGDVIPTEVIGRISTAGYCLKLPGMSLNLSALLYANFFRQHGYRKRALEAFEELEKAGLGESITTTVVYRDSAHYRLTPTPLFWPSNEIGGYTH